jgi:hypothetical protein
MIDKKIAHNIVRDILKRKQGISNHQIMHPEREWFLGLTAALIFLCLSTVWSVSLYRQYSSMNQNSSSSDTATDVVYRANAVDDALAEFAKRKQAYSDLKNKLLNQKIVTPTPLPILVTEETIATSSSQIILTEPIIIEPELIEDPAPLPPAETEPEAVPDLII